MNTILIILGLFFLLILYFVVSLFKMSLADFLDEVIVKKTLWLWLPFHALKRLSREFKEKYSK